MINILETIEIEGHELTIYGTKEEPLFLAVDIAKMIDYSTGNTWWMLNSVDPNEKVLLSTLSNSNSARGSASNKWFLTEYGMYEVLMQSRKPIARKFKANIKDILKDLRLKDELSFEDMFEHSDPLVDEWEKHNRDTGEDLDFAEWLHLYKGYTDDML
ncbi:MAG: Bro-N domain-containing protein [Bacilli bacterium]